MPLSNDNQDYSNKENKEKKLSDGTDAADNQKPADTETEMTTDDLKGKQQVDGDIEKETDRPAST